MPLGITELLLIAIVLLLLFGTSRIPKLARSVREARDELHTGNDGNVEDTQ
jgi:sec-independent protein translocase protein TatA